MIAWNVEYFESAIILCQNSLHLHYVHNACFPSIKLTALLKQKCPIPCPQEMHWGGKRSKLDLKRLPSIRDLKISDGVAKLSVYFLPSVAMFMLSFSFQSDVSRAKVKWIMLKIEWRHLQQQRAEEVRQRLSKFLFHGKEEHDNFQEGSLTPVVRSIIQIMQA